MGDEELELIRRRKLNELQAHAQQRVAEQEVAVQAQAQRAMILRQILTPEARERLGRIGLAYPDLVEGIENQLISLAQSGRVNGMIDDRSLQEILRRVIPKKREITIERR